MGAFGSLALLLGSEGIASGEVRPVDDLDVGAYLGRWYQTYGSATVKYSFEVGGRCVTADYGSFNNGSAVTVRNAVTVLGGRVVVEGFASPNPAQAGEFDVQLGPPGF